MPLMTRGQSSVQKFLTFKFTNLKQDFKKLFFNLWFNLRLTLISVHLSTYLYHGV